MRIAINIDGQFGGMTGIQHYVDSLLGALYDSNTSHEIIAFAPGVPSLATLNRAASDGLFAWRNNRLARTVTAGSGFRFSDYLPPTADESGLSRWAERLDRRVVVPFETKTVGRRVRWASRRYDLLHTPSPITPHFIDSRAKHHTVTIHDMTTRLYPATHDDHNVAIWERLFKHAQKDCSRVLTVSHSSKRDIVELLGIAEDRIDVTPLAARCSAQYVDLPTRREMLKALNLPDERFVLYAGTLEPRKNITTLIEAFELLLKEANFLPHKLVLAGGTWSREYRDELLRLISEAKLEGRVILTGYIKNETLNALMSGCDAFVYISQYEGFGLPPLEAMVCGAPVITSNVSSLPEVVGDAGIQVSPTNVEEVAAAMRILLDDSAENSLRRASSLERAKLFTWERTATLTLKSYEAASL